jgi:hypothetical protein
MTCLRYDENSCVLRLQFYNPFYTCRHLHILIYIINTHQQFWPRMFYRSGWLRCVGFISCVFVLCWWMILDSELVFELLDGFERLTYGVILYYYTHIHILIYLILYSSFYLLFLSSLIFLPIYFPPSFPTPNIPIPLFSNLSSVLPSFPTYVLVSVWCCSRLVMCSMVEVCRF